MNLKQLSDILGISQTTVSRALNGYPEVNKETRKRVEEAARKYGYTPSSVARRLAGKKVEAVGLVYPYDSDLRSSPVFLEMARMLSQRLRQQSIDFFIIPGCADEELILYQDMLKGGRVDSFIVAMTRRDDARIKWLLQRNIPFIAHGRSAVAGSYSWLDVDNRGSIKRAAEKLIALGHRKIALINPSDKYNFAWDRKQGLLDAFQANPTAMDKPILLCSSLDELSAYEVARHAILGGLDDRPSAFICSSMLNAEGVLKALSDGGLKAGEDVSVIAWDDGVSDLQIPDMSTIEAPVGKTGERIGELMLGVLRNEEKQIYQEVQETRIVLRGSVGQHETVPA